MMAGEIGWFATKPGLCAELADDGAGLEALNGFGERWPPATDCVDSFADEVSDWKACNAVDAAARASNIRELRYRRPVRLALLPGLISKRRASKKSQ
jgi:hypothetical protein